MALIDKAFANIESDESFNDFVEYACGHGNLSRGCLKKGFVGTALDILCDECHNCLHASGFLLWIESLMACRRRALVWFGTKCSIVGSLYVFQLVKGMLPTTIMATLSAALSLRATA